MDLYCAKHSLLQNLATVVVVLLFLNVAEVSIAEKIHRPQEQKNLHDPKGLSWYFTWKLMSRGNFDDLNDHEIRDRRWNYVISPVSIHNALALLLKGSSHRDKKIVQGIITKKGKYNVDSLLDYVTKIQGKNPFSNKISTKTRKRSHSSPKPEHQFQLDFWTLILLGQGLTLDPEYERLVKDKYHSNVMSSENKHVLNDINKWGKDKGFDRNIVKETDMPEPNKLTVFTALSIMGLWEQEFNEVVEKKFFLDSSNKEHTVLKSSQHFVRYALFNESYKYNPGDLTTHYINVTAVDIPLRGHNETSLTIICPFPESHMDLHALLDKVFENGHLDKVSKSATREVDLTIPKFKLDNKLDLKDALQRLNIWDLLEQKDFFNKIAKNSHTFDKAEHDAFIEVDKKGLKAAALTTIKQVLSAPPSKEKIPKVVIRGPFLFFVRQNGIILFSGKVAEL